MVTAPIPCLMRDCDGADAGALRKGPWRSGPNRIGDARGIILCFRNNFALQSNFAKNIRSSSAAAGRREAGCGYGARAGRAARKASMVLAGLNVRITVPEEFTNTAVTCSAGFALWSWPAP